MGSFFIFLYKFECVVHCTAALTPQQWALPISADGADAPCRGLGCRKGQVQTQDFSPLLHYPLLCYVMYCTPPHIHTGVSLLFLSRLEWNEP